MSNFWANKTSNPGAPRVSSPPSYSQQQSTPPTQPQPTYFPPEVASHQLPASATSQSRCPGCGSGNYGSADPSARARCYDCGYPIQQSGSGVGKGIAGPQPKGPTQASRQVTTGGFNPTTIIGHI